MGSPWNSRHPEMVQEAITCSPKNTTLASLVAKVAILLSVRRCLYLERTLAQSLNFSLLIAKEGKILAFFLGFMGPHLGG